MNKNSALGDLPKGTRLAAKQNAASEARIEREGGMYGAGLIRDVSAMTVGEAQGHGFWIDTVALAQVEKLGGQRPKGLKMRFTHPSLSADGTGKLVARPKDFRLGDDGQQVFFDAHITKSSKNAPSGDFGTYVMDVAEETPDLFATSAVIEFDREAEKAFMNANKNDDGEFRSPDKRNVEDLPHARFSALRAIDFVDNPAANPDGLFSALNDGGQLPKEIESALLYCIGVSDEKPAAPVLGVHPDRLRPFVRGVLERNLSAIMTRLDAMKKESMAGAIWNTADGTASYTTPGLTIYMGETGEILSEDEYRKLLQEKQNKESEATSGADSNIKEREDSTMEDLKSLTAEQLQEARPELVEKLQTTVREQCELDAKAQVDEGVKAEQQRCLGIVEAAEGVGVSEGISDSLKAGDTVEAATIKFQNAVIADLRAGADAGAGLSPTTVADAQKPETPPKEKPLSKDEKIAKRSAELQADGMGARDALIAAAKEIEKEDK
jgi:hypothetical protein